jgi:hypothetical protein
MLLVQLGEEVRAEESEMTKEDALCHQHSGKGEGRVVRVKYRGVPSILANHSLHEVWRSARWY